MKILQVISHYVPAYAFGGPLQMAHGMGRALLARGHDVTVVCTNLKDSATELDAPLDRPIMVDGVRVFYESVPILRYWGYSPGMKRRVRHEAKSHDVIFTHFHYQYATIAGAAAARRLGRPYVVFAHGSLNRHGVSARSATIKRLYLRWLETRNFRDARFVAYQSAEEMAQSFRFGKGEIVPIGVDLPAPRPIRQPAGGRLQLVYLGRLAEGKGLELLLAAMAGLISRFDLRLRLIGGDEHGYRSVLERKVSELGLQPRVEFAGLLLGAAKRDALSDADAFVMPSRSEGLSLATLEALAIGLPAIVTRRVALWREIEEHGAGYSCDFSVASISDAVCRMAECTDRVAMGQRGRSHVQEHYSWPRIVDGLLARISP